MGRYKQRLFDTFRHSSPEDAIIILQLRVSAFVIALLLVTIFAAPAAADAAAVGPDAVAYQISPEHVGAVTFQNFSTMPVKLWSTNLGGAVSYPLIAQGEIYVTSVNPSVNGAVNLQALNAQTGHIDWSVVLNGGGNAAYDNGKVFVVQGNGFSSTMNAYNATTGALLWKSVLPGQYFFNAPPTARNGIAYTTGFGTGGTLYALSESSGATLWTAPVANGDGSSPTVTGGGVYVSYLGPQTYDFKPTTGGLNWHFDAGVEGAGGATAVYYNGNLYVRDIFDYFHNLPNDNMLLLNGATGQPSTTFNDSAFASATAPAFFNSRGYLEAGGTLNEFDPVSGSVGWSQSAAAGDSFVTAPILVNGVVFEGTAMGYLYEFVGLSGSLLNVLNVGTSLRQTDGPLAGLGAGDGLLVVPAGNTLNVYSVTTPEPSAVDLLLAAGTFGLLGWGWRRWRVARRPTRNEEDDSETTLSLSSFTSGAQASQALRRAA
jgi:outer membrane protein assembly factor BamB